MTTLVLLTTTLALALMPIAASAQLSVPMPQVILDNASVRVTAVTFPPGAGTGRHQGIEPEVGIAVDGELTLESPQGRALLRPGTAYFVPGLTPHDTRNEGARPVRLFEVFLKRCD
jgi:mannose-6-phosphate isomerase-like protein (cupin superfamily)